MNKRIAAFTLLVFGVVGPLVLADEVRGVVTKVDPDKKEVLLDVRARGTRGTMTFVVDKDSQVLFGKVAGALNELATGRRVRLDYESRDGKLVVTTIIAPPGARQVTPPAKTADNAVTGTLQRVALTDHEIVVIGADGKSETTFSVPESAKVMKNDKQAKLDDLKEGDKVAVVGEKRDGKLTASTIQVGGSGLPAGADKSRVARLRSILQMVDQFLEMAEKRGEKP